MGEWDVIPLDLRSYKRNKQVFCLCYNSFGIGLFMLGYNYSRWHGLFDMGVFVFGESCLNFLVSHFLE